MFSQELNDRVSALAASAVQTVDNSGELLAQLEAETSDEARVLSELDTIRSVIDAKEARIRSLTSNVHRLEFDVQAARTDAQRYTPCASSVVSIVPFIRLGRFAFIVSRFPLSAGKNASPSPMRSMSVCPNISRLRIGTLTRHVPVSRPPRTYEQRYLPACLMLDDWVTACSGGMVELMLSHRQITC